MQFPNSPQKVATRPKFLTEADFPIVSHLVEMREKYLGHPESAYTQDFESSLEKHPHPQKLRSVERSLKRLWLRKTRRKKHFSRDRIQHFLELPKVEESTRPIALDELFGDIRELRKVEALRIPLQNLEVVQEHNLSLLKSLLSRSLWADFRFSSNLKSFVRVAKWRGLIIENLKSRSSEDLDSGSFRVSGPLSLFCQTPLYSNSLLSLFTILTWDQSFEAQLLVLDKEGKHSTLLIKPFEGMKIGRQPKKFDSKVEVQFQKSFVQAFNDWVLSREAVFLLEGGKYACPDFVATHRLTGKQVLVEIVGYWRGKYLEKKLANLKEILEKPSSGAQIHMIAVVDNRILEENPKFLQLNCHVLRFSKSIDCSLLKPILTDLKLRE